MNPDEIVRDPSEAKSEAEFNQILKENELAKERHSARKEQEMLDKPTLFERAAKKVRKLFNMKEKEKVQAAQQFANNQKSL